MKDMDKQSDEDIDCTSDETNECQEMTSKLNMKNVKKVYAKDSMDRLGDDLSEEVIQYLTFGDKVKLESVSKQWRRLVFSKQFAIDLLNGFEECKDSLSAKFNDIKPINRKSLESVLKKCPNICRVSLSEELCDMCLKLITKYCRRVTKLRLAVCCEETALMSFATKHGMWLQEFTIRYSFYDREVPKYVKNFLQMCPNIKNIDINYNPFCFNEIFGESLMKLQFIKRLHIRDNHSNILELLVNKYGTRLKGIQIELNGKDLDELKTCFAHISRFESLESLELEIQYYDSEQAIKECFILLANECTKLRELGLKLNIPIIPKLYLFLLSELRSLEKLVIDFGILCYKLEGSVECLKHLTRLKYLSITNLKLTEDFFTNINTIVPNIRYLEIKVLSGIDFFDKCPLKLFLKSLQTMKFIERVVYNYRVFYYCKNRSESKQRILLLK